MKFSPVLRIVSNHTVELIRKQIKQSLEEAPQHLKYLKENRQAILYNKISDLNKWYTKIIGLDEVKSLQDKVISMQDRLLDIQERRREVGKQLADIRQKSLLLQDELHKVKRQDDMDKFLELMKEETEILKLEQNVSKTFQEYDRTEREIFTAFTNTIRDSHEKQRAQMEYTRYFGLILGITGSFLTFFYSTIRKHDLKKFIEKHMQNITVSQTLDPQVIKEINNSNLETRQDISVVKEQVKELVKVMRKNNNTVLATPILNDEDQYVDKWLKIGGALVVVYILLNMISK